MSKLKIAIVFLLTATAGIVQAQVTSTAKYTLADTLRGSYGPARAWWDAVNYNINVRFNLLDSTISGFNEIAFKILSQGREMQIDLQAPLLIDSIIYSGKKLDKANTRKMSNAYFITPGKLSAGAVNRITIYYHGKPRIARRAPWDGGLSWSRDKNKNPFISISCQQLGASVWYPCKDHQADEPDKASLTITAPSNLAAISNGRMVGKKNNPDSTTTTTWSVVNPINNYCIIPYIGKYVHFSEKYKGEHGTLDLDYWVLDYNLNKARKQFKDVVKTMQAFEYWFGPYPFYEDGYKLIDAPYLGMEHQSAVAYGNGYQNGYLGKDLSGNGGGMLFDFIIVHETGHEWWGNNITTKDIADMWVHEGFTDYSETLFLEYHYGKDTANSYVQGIRKKIMNDIPITGPYNVNREGSGDMYYKGGNMIHTIRQVINDDVKFRSILRGLNKDFRHSTVTGKQVEEYISRKSGIDFSKVFDQYLRTVNIPTLEYKISKGMITYRWANCVEGFKMPVNIRLDKQKLQTIKPSANWNILKANASAITIDPNFYVLSLRLNK